MKTRIILLLSLLQTTVLGALAQSSDTLWVSYDNRFKPFNSISIKGSDSVEVTVSAFKLYTNGSASTRTYSTLFSNDEANLMFSKDRYLLKPQTYSGTDYQNDKATTGYNFAHHVESEHFAVFWDARYGNNPKNIKHPDNGSIANAYDVLAIAEKCWDSYVTDLGFVVPGTSTTDRLKIQLYIPYQSDWRADAAGDNGQDANGTWGFTGIGHFNPWAATARGGHTVAHEVGHTFQYLVSADLGTDAAQHYDRGWRWGWGGGNDNGWWESCADWQAYQIFPDRQFTDGEYFEQHLAKHYLNLLHEDWRYACCYIHDWWAMLHGRRFIGLMWRESQPYEDPIQVYKRINNLSQEQFNNELMEGYMRMATWDIDGVRDRAKHRIGQHKKYISAVSGQSGTYTTSPATCIQNYGYHITNMSLPVAGTTVKATFTGLTDATGYRYVNKDKAGWRYAFVALQSNGTRTYGEVKSDKEGVAELTIPENCTNLFFVVMGAPTEHWSHPWTSGKASTDWPQNDEQWPYQVKFEKTNPK